MNKSMLQRILHRNKRYITNLLEALANYKLVKRMADEDGEQAVEYEAHNMVNRIRAEIAKLVDEQKAIKAIVNSKG